MPICPVINGHSHPRQFRQFSQPRHHRSFKAPKHTEVIVSKRTTTCTYSTGASIVILNQVKPLANQAQRKTNEKTEQGKED